MSTNEVSALTRIIKFENVFSSVENFSTDSSYKILKLTHGSYYKIFLTESTGTSIIEILNNAIYSICTPSERYILLDNDSLFLSGFEQTTDIIIEYYEEFNFNVTASASDIRVDANNNYNTEGNLDYRQNFRTENFSANNVDVETVVLNKLTCNAIILNKWQFTEKDGSIVIGLQQNNKS